MKLSEFLQDIALGELSGSSLVEVGSYEIDRNQIPRVIHALNQGLEYFHSNFPIKENMVVIKLQTGITKYYLDSMYAYSNPTGSIKFICDTYHKPFLDDVLHIQSVSNSNGFTYPLNDDFDNLSIRTPEFNCIEIPEDIKSEYLIIKYQANHPRIPLDIQDYSQVHVQIPSSYRTALQTYVACLVLQNLGGQHHNESNALFAKFKTLTEELKLNGIGVITQTNTNIKPQLRGWV